MKGTQKQREGSQKTMNEWGIKISIVKAERSGGKVWDRTTVQSLLTDL